MENQDWLRSFLFENKSVRGVIISAGESCRQLVQGHAYPACVTRMMYELAASAAMVSSGLKDGSELMLQIKGSTDSPLRYALCNVRPDLSFYGSASLAPDRQVRDDAGLAALAGPDAVMSITVFPPEGRHFQGVVALDPESVSASLEQYFSSSQQLPTRFFLRSSPADGLCGGLLLQALPGDEHVTDDLNDLSVLAGTVTGEELGTLPAETVLGRLFADEDIRIFPKKTPAFRCNCSEERCLSTLSSMSLKELSELLAIGGTQMTCQHCGTTYTITPQKLKTLLSGKK